MRRFAILACFGALLGMKPTPAQPQPPGQYRWYHEGNHQAYPDSAELLVNSWYQKFLRRAPGAGEQMGWVQSLHAGQPPQKTLAGIVGSQEYYTNAGGTPEGFVQTLFADLTGRRPTEQEFRYWMSQLAYGYGGPDVTSRSNVAYALLLRYPQVAPTPAPYFPDDSRYHYHKPVYSPYRH